MIQILVLLSCFKDSTTCLQKKPKGIIGKCTNTALCWQRDKHKNHGSQNNNNQMADMDKCQYLPKYDNCRIKNIQLVLALKS